MVWFGLASFSPAAVLLAACLWGGIWPALALVWITVFVAVIDRLTSVALPANARMEPAARRLNIVLGVLHLAMLPLLVWTMANARWLSPADIILILIAAGLY